MSCFLRHYYGDFRSNICIESLKLAGLPTSKLKGQVLVDNGTTEEIDPVGFHLLICPAV